MRFARSTAVSLALALIAATAVLTVPEARADEGNIATRCDANGCDVIRCDDTGDRCVRLDRRYRDRGAYNGGYDGYYDGGERRYRERKRYRSYSEYRYREGYVYRDRSGGERYCGYNTHLCSTAYDRHGGNRRPHRGYEE